MTFMKCLYVDIYVTKGCCFFTTRVGGVKFGGQYTCPSALLGGSDVEVIGRVIQLCTKYACRRGLAPECGVSGYVGAGHIGDTLGVVRPPTLPNSHMHATHVTQLQHICNCHQWLSCGHCTRHFVLV